MTSKLFACCIMISHYRPLVFSLTLYMTVSGGGNCSEYRLFYRGEHAVLLTVLQRFALYDKSHDF